MADNNREDDEEDNIRPVELETHRFTPPPMDPDQEAEISKLSAEIDEADNWELTIEIVEVEKSPPREFPEVIATPDEGSDKRRKSKTPNSSGKKSKTRSPLIPLEFPEMENNTPESYKSKTGTPTSSEKRNMSSPLVGYGLEEELVEPIENDENAIPQAPKKPVPRRKSIVQNLRNEFSTPTSNRKRKSVADELTDMFGTPRSSKKRLSTE